MSAPQESGDCAFCIVRFALCVLPRLSTVASKPFWSASRVHDVLMVPVPPMNRTFMVFLNEPCCW